MRIKPTRDWVIIEQAKESRTILVSKDKSKSSRGRVLAVGAGKRNKKGVLIPPDVQVGQIVIFKKYAAKLFYVEQKKLFFIESDNILGVIDKIYTDEDTKAQHESFFTQGSEHDDGTLSENPA